jgi:16S rRNA (cytosine967-C5)-methyltransferase
VVEDFLATNPGWRLFPASKRVDKESTHGDYLQVLPHRHNTDGFFGAILERSTTQ